MPHDKNGKLVEVGQRVSVSFEVKQVFADEGYCNCMLETVEPMYPGDSKTALTVNTKQVEIQSE